MKYKLIGLLFFLIGTLNGFAQKPTAVASTKRFIAALADGRGSELYIRWAPSNTLVWQAGIKYGYTLERFTVQRDGKPTKELLTKPSLIINNIKPLANEEWEKLIAVDERAAIVQSGIYPDSADKIISKGNSLESLMQNQNEADIKMGFSIFVCDLNPKFAEAAGLLYIDKAIKSNERYIYKISLANNLKIKNVNPGILNIGPNQKQILPKLKIDNIQWGNKLAVLNWDTRSSKGIYTAYFIEKSTDGKTFKKVSDLPIITASENEQLTKSSYEDSLLNNEIQYYYRLVGITAFGEYGPASDVVSGKGFGANEVLPIITRGKGDNIKRQVFINWVFPVTLSKDLQEFQVLRANKADGSYLVINTKTLLPNDTSFVDSKPIASNYYKIKAIGKDGQIAISFPYLVNVFDADPPTPPIGLNAKISDSGYVTLKWKQNKETDLYGYRIFRANSGKEEFIEITNDFVFKNIYYDTVSVETLTKEVFYRVVAVDQNYNNSKFSEALLLKRPDLIPPTKPLLLFLKMNTNSLSMEWTPSASDDVVKYVLQRVDKKTYEVKDILVWNPNKVTMPKLLIDSAVKLGNTYYYQLLVYDDAGNNSFNRTGEMEYETGFRPAVSDFKAVVNLKDKLVTLVWSYPKAYEVEQYTIYRCIKGEPMEIYTTVLGTKTYLEEKKLYIGNFYQYQIKAEIKGGLRTIISKVVEVAF